MADTRIVQIDRLGAQGDGIADTESGALFVPGALPGDHVEIAGEGQAVALERVVEPSPDRVTPPCRHFGTCGGCSAQHMGVAPYREWKRGIVVQALGQRGLEPPVAELIAIAPATRRRVTMEARREGGKVALGFHAQRSHALIDIAACHVMVPALEAALPQLRALATDVLAAAPRANGTKGALRLTLTATATGLDVAMESGDLVLGPDVRIRLAQGAAAAGYARLTLDGELMVRRDRCSMLFGDADVDLPTAAFVQATAEAEAVMAELVTAAAPKAKRVADLFCGLGTFTFPLARRARVLAADDAKDAIAALKDAALRAKGLKPIEARLRDLIHEPLSRKELEEFDAVVFDPPRAGAQRQAEALARSVVPVVVAVSCNPATLARDARILVDGGYEIETVTPVDQFVWSPHIEAVAVFRRARRTR